MDGLKVIMVIFVLSSLLASCSSIPKEKQCTVDSDCVAATCCHATDVVNKEFRPDCSSVLCSAVCEEGTLDCGQMVPSCIEGACVAIER